MKPWRSTTFRFAALIFLLQIAAALALLVLVQQLTRGQINGYARNMAATSRDDLLALERRDGFEALAAVVRDRSTLVQSAHAVFLLTDPRGRAVAGNIAAWPPTVAVPADGQSVKLSRIGRDPSELMRVTATALPGGGRLLTGHALDDELRFIASLREAMISSLLLALAFAGVAAWLTARMIVQRLGQTVATLEAVRRGDPKRRVTLNASGDAFEVLAREVNMTLDRSDALLEEVRVATDGLAHDLKSPLTRLRSALERALADVGDGSGRQGVERALAESDRLLALVETALRITRAEAGIGIENFVETDLADELQKLEEIYGPLVEERGFSIVVDATAGVQASVHQDLLRQALGNLIDNALKYGDGQITLSARALPDGVLLGVGDRGPGIRSDRHDAALRRFGRLDESRAGSGVGLGLSLAVAVAKLHGGSLTLSDAAPGLLVEMHLRSTRATQRP